MHTAAKKTVTNEDLLGIIQDLMQMTHNGFGKLEGRMDGLEVRMGGLDSRMGGLEGRMDGLEGRMDELESQTDGLGNQIRKVETRLDKIEGRLAAIETTLQSHDLQLAELKAIAKQLLSERAAYLNDVKDILDRISALEQRLPDVTEQEVRELQRLLQSVVDWAVKVASAADVPLKLSP